MPQQLCRCGQPSHPLYQSRCEDCWAYDNRNMIASDVARRNRAVSGLGNDEDSRMISNQGPQSNRWIR